VSKSKSENWGHSAIYLGIGIVALSLIVIWFYTVNGSEPPAGRTTNTMLFGVPVGVVVIIMGIMKTSRERRR
jgi:hypothetical protein